MKAIARELTVQVPTGMQYEYPLRALGDRPISATQENRLIEAGEISAETAWVSFLAFASRGVRLNALLLEPCEH